MSYWPKTPPILCCTMLNRCTNARVRVRGAHDGFGIALCTTLACILSIIAISWGNWSQTDMLISEEENVATYSGTELSVSGSEEVWGEYLEKCPDCKKVSKLTMTRNPSDWCVTITQLVFQPWEHLSTMTAERRLSRVLTSHTNYTVWTNTSCVSEMGSYLDDNICNATWVDLRAKACERAPAEIEAFPNATAYPFAFWRWVQLQCTTFEHVCEGTGSVLGLHVVGLLFLVVATFASIAGPFAGDKYKAYLLVTVAMQVLSWIFLLSALLVFSNFNSALNAPREMYTKMLVHGEQSGATESVATIFGEYSGLETGTRPYNYANSGAGIAYNDARLDPYTAYPALKPPGPIANYIDTVLETKPRWDWAQWTFSKGFFAGASAIMWLTVATILTMAALRESKLKPDLLPTRFAKVDKACGDLPVEMHDHP